MIKHNVLVIIPTYNEDLNITNMIISIINHCPCAFILVVDDLSEDKTVEYVNNLKYKYQNIHVLCRNEKRSYAQSMLLGFEWAVSRNFNIVITMDADLSHNPKEIPYMLGLLHKYDVCIGSRYVSGIRVINWNILRLLLSRCANIYLWIFLKMKISDNTSGYRAYRIDVIKKILEYNYYYIGYSFLFAILWYAILERFTIYEHPITFCERKAGKSKLSLFIILEALFVPIVLWFQYVIRLIKC